MISLRQLTRREDGQDLMEYGLLVSLIAIAMLFGIRMLATGVTDTFWGTIASIDLF